MSAAGGGGPGAVVRQGHLRKLKTMKKKFFVLRGDSEEVSARLEYYESEKKFRAGASPRRALPLKSCYNIMRRLDLKQKHVIALFTREEQFCVVAENETELHAWLAALLRQHRSDDASDELLHPIQHVWQVNVQKKGLGASKNILGLYNLCLTDKTLTLVKIKSHNNFISDITIPERVEYTLKNIRRCGDSECFYYMEVGRQTTTGAGELWMHCDDSNIAQSMHSTIYHAMRNCAKETENERDHIVIPKTDAPAPRRFTYSDGRGRAGLLNAENHPPNNTLTDKPADSSVRVIKHHRTVSLPTGCPLFQEPLKIWHGRTRSAPLTGDEVDRAITEKSVTHSSCKAINGTDAPPKKSQWSRRASTGTRLSKLSPAHSKNAGTQRNRADSMPSRAYSSFEMDRPQPRHNEFEGVEAARDEPDGDWYRTPRIPEEPDTVDASKELVNSFTSTVRTGGSIQHSRTSSIGHDEPMDADGYLHMTPGVDPLPDGYLPMAPGHDPLGGLISASSGSVCSGTPSTDPRFSEYQLEPAMSHISMETRPPRAYSVGSRPAGSGAAGGAGPAGGRHRAYSVGARNRPAPRHHNALSAPQLPRASAEDLMELDFSNNSPAAKTPVPHMPAVPAPFERPAADEYVDMSPRIAGYVTMRPGDRAPDGYVEMNFRTPTRPIDIAAARAPPPAAAPAPHSPHTPPDELTPLGDQPLFPLSLESPAEPEPAPDQVLSTVREAEEGRRAEPASSPQYVVLASRPPAHKGDSGAPLVVAGGGAPARFTVGGALNYAALDLEARCAPPPPAPRTYTQIDFARSEKLHADAT